MRRWFVALITLALLYNNYLRSGVSSARAHGTAKNGGGKPRPLDSAVMLRDVKVYSGTSIHRRGDASSLPTLPSASFPPPASSLTTAAGGGGRAGSSSGDPSQKQIRGRGQCEQARVSVKQAIAKQRPPPGGDELWGGVQSGWGQANKESDNVRALLRADGMPKWRPANPSTGLPPQRPANATMEQLLEHTPTGSSAWLAFGNSGVAEMLLNWAHHVMKLGAGWQMVIAAFDEPLLALLHEHALPAYNYSGALPATHFRHAPHLFHRMGFLKAELIVHVLRTGRHALVSDSDVVWVADPQPLLASLHAKGMTLAASTDCLDVEADRDKASRKVSPVMCGHAPGNTGLATFNTGVLWFASHESAITFAQEWALGTLALTDPYSDDQGVFNRLILRGLYPVVAHSNEGDVIKGPGSLRIAPLPAEKFCSGHLVHVQRAADVTGCLSVHATFTEYGDAGKRWRFLEAKLWALNEDAYYSEGRYLAFVPPKPQADPMPCKVDAGVYVPGVDAPQACGGEDPRHGMPPKRFGDIMWTEALKRSVRLRENQKLMSRQTHALRDALAIARILNRTLILPHYDCLCDRSEDVAIVPSCVYHGAPPRMAVPFRCSQHFVADTHKLQMMSLDPMRFGMQPHKFNGRPTPPIRLRAFSFLSDSRTSAEIKEGVVDVRVVGYQGGGKAAAGGQIVLRKGSTNVAVKAQLQSLEGARVIRLSDAEGVFSGWESERNEALHFNTMMDYYVHRGAWCCSSRNQAQQDDGRVYVTPPPRLRVP